MPRKPRQVSPTCVYHFINRGVNKKQLFHTKGDFEFYLSLLKEYCQKFDIAMYHYCLMPNHVHLLVKADPLANLSMFAALVQRRYVYYYCKTYRWSEQLFKSRFISLPIQEESYLLECGRYIERNPLKAHLVSDPKEYLYSSYRYYAHAKPDELITPSPLYDSLGRTRKERMVSYRFYVTHTREQEKKLPVPF